MNLIYMCVFHQENYIRLLKLLITSISVKANINKATTDILIVTSPTFQPLIQKELEDFGLPLRYYILDLHTMMDASCCKLKIFSYTDIDRYEKILYLDTDVLVNSDVNTLFGNDISPDKLYALEEGDIGSTHWGSEFFDFTQFDVNTPAFSAGVFYFMNSVAMKTLFDDTNAHIANYLAEGHPAPTCLDQPFLVYNSFIQGKYDNQRMKAYVENNPDVVSTEKIVYHFPGGPGSYSSKLDKMTRFWEKMKVSLFDTRNDMITHYCSRISNPNILEIGVFKGEFLDYLVKNCGARSIDAVDLFEGMTCSGNADGNNVIHYDVGQSYLELLETYKDTSNVHIIKQNSVSFLQAQDDNHYDVIYIDGDHSYEGVKQDLTVAFRKIKNNGYIMGHDYEMNMNKAHHIYDFGVKRAVDEFCITYNQTIVSKALDGCVSYCMNIKKQ